MKVIACGKVQNPVLLMIHGNLTDAKSCYRRIIPALEKEYRVVLPFVDGFTGDSREFLTVEDTAEQIEQYMIKQYPDGIYGICGISMGGTITVELLARGRIKPQKAWIDAAFCVDLGWKASVYTGIFVLLSQMLRPVERFQGIKKGLYRICPALKAAYFGCSVKTEYRVCNSVYHYVIPESLGECKSEVMFLYGEKEKYPAESARRIKEYLPKMRIKVIPKANHAAYLMFHPKQYAQTLLEFLA